MRSTARAGLVRTKCSRRSPGITKSATSPSATASALRGAGEKSAISPKSCPSASVRRVCSRPCVRLRMATLPEWIRNASPLASSPSRKIAWPAAKRRSWAVGTLLMAFSSEGRRDGVAQGGGACPPADVRGEGPAGRQDLGDGRLDPVARGGRGRILVAIAEPAEHQRGGEDHGRRVRDALAGDVGRGPVRGLEERPPVADVAGGRHAEAADGRRAEV